MPQNFEKHIVPFRWIISKKECVISVVDVGEMEVANINSKTTRTVSHEPINCAAKKTAKNSFQIDYRLQISVYKQQ